MSTVDRSAALPPLRNAHASQKLSIYLRELVERRSYVWHVATNELRHRQITNVLGNLWHLLNPALTIGVYYLVFGLLLDTNRGVDKFFLFLTVGLMIFTFTQKATIDGAKSIVTNKGIVKAVRFPRALLPISSTTTELLATMPNLIVMFVVALLSGVLPSIRWLALVPVIGLQMIFTLGLAMIAARLSTHFVDTIQILPFIFRLLLYGSGVIFSVEAYVSSDQTLVRAFFTANPMYCFITLARWAVIGGDFQPELAAIASIWAAVVLVGGFLWFRAGEEGYARD